MSGKRSPLRNPEAERSCLGSLLIDPKLIDEITSELRAECFYDDILGQIFATMQGMRAAGTPIDVTTVYDVLESQKIGQQVTLGSAALLNELMESVAVAYHADYHAKRVVECWKRRQALQAAENMIRVLKDGSNNLDDALGGCDAAMREIEESCLPKSQIDIADLLIECLDEKDRCKQGLETGFPTLDHMTTGLHGGQMIIVAARTSIGKSALVGNIATTLAQREIPVFVSTLEMSKADFIYRMASQLSGLHMWQIKSPDIQYHEPILEAFNVMARWPMFIDDTVPQTVSQIGAKARMLVRKHGVKLIIIDYLQLVAPDDKRAQREQQIAAISRALKLLAKQLRIPIIALSQLNRQSENRANKMPQLSDIRESGAVEQDADGVWLLHRPGFGDVTADETEAELIVAKNRHGATGPIKLEWDGPRFTFRERDSLLKF